MILILIKILCRDHHQNDMPMIRLRLQQSHLYMLIHIALLRPLCVMIKDQSEPLLRARSVRFPLNSLKTKRLMPNTLILTRVGTQPSQVSCGINPLPIQHRVQLQVCLHSLKKTRQTQLFRLRLIMIRLMKLCVWMGLTFERFNVKPYRRHGLPTTSKNGQILLPMRMLILWYKTSCLLQIDIRLFYRNI